jgi:hypothetical protein
MPRYFITFTASRDHHPMTTHHTRVVFLDYPIDYDSDICRVQEWAAEDVEAKVAMLTSWRELKGAVRPGAYHCPACRLELTQDRCCDLCGQRCTSGELPVTDSPSIAPAA